MLGIQRIGMRSDYGLFAANSLGHKIFSEGKNELNFSMIKGSL